MSFWKSIQQEVIADTNNSSSTNISTTEYFSGAASNTLGVAGIQVSLKTDENCTVWVDQAPTDQLVDCPTGVTAATNNSTTITGTGSYFTKNFAIGDVIVYDPTGTNQTKTVASITSDTVMIVTEAFTGGSLSGKAFKLYPWDIRDPFNYYANNNFGVTVQAVSSHFRVRVYNTGAATTKYFRLQTALCPIVEALPRTLSEEGNLKVGVYEIENEVGNKVRISPNGALDTHKVTRLVGAAFSGTTIDSSFWTATVSNNGSGVQTGGQFELRTITAPATSSPNGNAALQSTRVGRYINGIPNYCRVQCDYGGQGVENNTKRWGMFTGTAGSPTDGAMFEVINQVPTLATYSGGVANRISNGDFNGNYGKSLPTIPSGLQTFEIIYNNRDVYFFFNNVLVHKIEATTVPWSSTLSLPLRAENYNTGDSTTDTSLKIRSFVICRMGEAAGRPQWKNQAGAVGATVLKRGTGTLKSVVVNKWVDTTTISVYDALSATNPIAIITPGRVGNTYTLLPFVLTYDLDFYTGLTYVTTTACDVTFVFE